MRPNHIRITIPSTATVGDSIRAIVDVRNPDETTSFFFHGRVAFKTPSAFDMAEEHLVNKGEGGRFVVENIRIKKKGVHRIEALCGDGAVRGISNPIEVREKGGEYGLFWGDLHGHSGISDGTGTPDEYYRFARDVAGLDVCALTDHDVRGDPITDGEWDETKAAAQRFYEPGAFVTFLGYEWTADDIAARSSACGHHCIYFLDDYENAKRFARSDPDTNTPEKLWEQYRGKNVMTIVNHPAVNNPPLWYHWDYRNDDLQSLVEIYSTWGSSETSHKRKNTRPIRRLGGMAPKNSHVTVQDALTKGFRLGFIGGSDGYDCRPGDSNFHVGDPPLIATEKAIHEGHFYSSGLTAVLATKLTRDSVWEAMKKRRTYATTGVRIILNFTISDHAVGEEIAMSKREDPVLKLHVVGTAPLKRISIVRNNKDIYAVAPRSDEASLTFVDREKRSGVSYYYIRVVQQDGHMAWSSPIWVIRPEREKKLARVKKVVEAKRRALKQKRAVRKNKKHLARIAKAERRTLRRKRRGK